MSTLYFVIALAMGIAFNAAFIILFISKIGLRNYLIAISPKLISQLFDCDFCLSFWLSLVLASILAIIFGNPYILFISILSTPVARFLL